MSKQVVIDIDGILWSISEAWYEELIKINPDIPFPGLTNWEFFKDYMTWDEAYKAATAVHMRQDQYRPFRNADKLTYLLRIGGYRVVIASHRHEDSKSVTARWLTNNNIYFDELYTGKDKHPYLEDSNTMLFIDDAPHSQQIAVDKGIMTFSIIYPYNQHMNNVVFFKDFNHLLSGVENWISGAVNADIRKRTIGSLKLRAV